MLNPHFYYGVLHSLILVLQSRSDRRETRGLARTTSELGREETAAERVHSSVSDGGECSILRSEHASCFCSSHR